MVCGDSLTHTKTYHTLSQNSQKYGVRDIKLNMSGERHGGAYTTFFVCMAWLCWGATWLMIWGHPGGFNSVLKLVMH